MADPREIAARLDYLRSLGIPIPEGAENDPAVRQRVTELMKQFLPQDRLTATQRSERAARSSIENAALRGAAQGATFNFADELSGLVSSAVPPAARAGLGRLAAPEGQEAEYAAAAMGLTYEDVRDAAREQAARSQAEDPAAYFTGYIPAALATGRMATGPTGVLSQAPGVGTLVRTAASPSATALQRAGSSALLGAGEASLAAVGANENPETLGEEIGWSAIIGGGISGGTSLAGSAIGGVSEAIRGRRLARARQAGITTPRGRREITQAARTPAEADDAIAEEMALLEEEGVFRGGLLPRTTEEVQENIGLLQTRAGQDIGAVAEEFGSTPLAPQEVRRLVSWAENQIANLPQGRLASSTKRVLRNFVADMNALGPDATLNDINRYRSFLGRVAFRRPATANEVPTLSASKDIYGQLTETQQRILERASRQRASRVTTQELMPTVEDVSARVGRGEDVPMELVDRLIRSNAEQERLLDVPAGLQRSNRAYATSSRALRAASPQAGESSIPEAAALGLAGGALTDSVATGGLVGAALGSKNLLTNPRVNVAAQQARVGAAQAAETLGRRNLGASRVVSMGVPPLISNQAPSVSIPSEEITVTPMETPLAEEPQVEEEDDFFRELEGADEDEFFRDLP